MARTAITREVIIKECAESTVSWGKILNYLRDIAEIILPQNTYIGINVKMNQDARKCEDQDGVLLNGQYFDWKQFQTKKKEIIAAFLDYFTDDQCKKIYKKHVDMVNHRGIGLSDLTWFYSQNNQA